MTTTATATGKAPTYTLYAAGASFRAFATLVAAEYGGIDVRVSTDGASAAAAKSPVGKLPVLEVSNHGGDGDDDGGVDGDGTGAETTTAVIFGSHAMARYVGSLRRDVGLMGRSALETALIDGWMDYAAQELELPACVWFYPVVGYMPFNAVAYEKAKKDFAKGLTYLEDHLSKKQQQQQQTKEGDGRGGGEDHRYLVGSSITMADIVVVSTLLYPFKLVADTTYLKPYPSVVRWFRHCASRPEFRRVVGTVAMCQHELKPPSLR